MQFWQTLKTWKYFDDLAFVVAVLFVLIAWKFAIEGLVTDAIE